MEWIAFIWAALLPGHQYMTSCCSAGNILGTSQGALQVNHNLASAAVATHLAQRILPGFEAFVPPNLNASGGSWLSTVKFAGNTASDASTTMVVGETSAVAKVSEASVAGTVTASQLNSNFCAASPVSSSPLEPGNLPEKGATSEASGATLEVASVAVDKQSQEISVGKDLQEGALMAAAWAKQLDMLLDVGPTLTDAQRSVYGLTETSQRFQGTASWYGPYFHGRKTATGEVFDQHSLTAAHKTLPFGTYLKVRNLLNDRTVVVRINDRGPYVGERSLDLSYAAAQCLNSEVVGVIPYEATILKPNVPDLASVDMLTAQR
jgi:rare lipoprotein A (peptidoglycan hydrolase)